MATEADIGETILLKEKCSTPGELYQPPHTVDYLVKSGNVEVARNVEVEIVNSSFEGNAGVTAGESFSELPLIAATEPDQETNTKQETCQAIEISYQGEKTMPEPEQTQIKREGSFKATQVKEMKEHEVVDEINNIAAVGEIGHQTSDNTGISSKMEKIEQPYLEVGEEEISKEEIFVTQVEADKQSSVEENQMNIEKETITPQKDQGRKEDNNTDLKAGTMLEASKDLNEEPPVLTTDLIDVETSTQASQKNEHEHNVGFAETMTVEEINTKRTSEGVQGEEKSPNVAKPIEKEREEKDISHDSIEEASPIPVQSLELQTNDQENSKFMEDAKDKFDSPSVTLASDRSSMQEETSNVASTEESQDATNLNDNTNDIVSSVDQTHVEISSDTQTKDLSLQEVDKTEIAKMITETLQEDYVKGGPQETITEALGIKPEADSYGGAKVMDEATPEGKLDSFTKHEDGDKNIHEEMTILDASALENRDEDMDAAVAGEENIGQAVLQNNQEESGKEKNLSSIELNQKIEIVETEFHDKNSNETHSFEQETILVESKELGQDSNLEPGCQLHEASGDRYDEKKNENDSCESTENNANRVVTSEQSSETSENEIEKLEKVHELGSKYQSEIKDGEMGIKEDKHEKEEACETEKHKSEITDNVSAKCHTEESGSETISSTDFPHETMEQNFQAGSLHEAATALKDEEEEDEKTSTTNDGITGIEKVTDEEIIRANATNLSSEVINEENIEGYLQIDKEINVSKGEDIEDQIIDGTNTACISFEAIEEAPVKNFKRDENNIDNPSSREILMESRTAETVGNIGNEAKRSNDETLDSTLQSSLVQEQEILHSENLITSEGSSAEEISMTNDKENHTDQPQGETGEHKDILKGVEYLEQIKETEATLSQPDANTVQGRVDLPQADESAAEPTKEENITNGRCIGSALQEAVDEDLVIFQKNESCIGESNAEITGESIAAATCKNITSETARNAECLIETIPTSLEDTNASNECFEISIYDKDDTNIENQEQSSNRKDSQEALVDADEIRNEISKDENLPSRELNEKTEITEGETPDKKINELNATRSLEKELGEITNFETQKQVHEAIGGGDEVKNDEAESQGCKGPENTGSQPPSAKEAENTEKSEAEIEKLEKVNASESKEEVENKDTQMSIEENIGNKEESCEEDLQNLGTSDDTGKYHTEEVFNHEEIEQNFQAEETSTTSEGEENSRQTLSAIDKEITDADEVADDENIKENFKLLSSEVTKKETVESPQQAEKVGDITAGDNTEETIILQKSIEEEPIENFQSYENNSGKPSSRQNFEESETAETVASTADETKQTDTSPNSTPQSSLVTGHESSQSENQIACDGSPAEEIVMDGSSIKEAEAKESYSELAEGGEHSKELLEEEEDVEQRLRKDNIEQPLHVISLETKAEALSEIDNITVKETAQSLQENEERDAEREKDVILLKGEEDAEQILQNDNIELQTEAEASSQTDNSMVKETAESPQENERDSLKEKEDGVNESNSKCLQVESVAQNSVKDFENDDKRVEKSNTEILEVSEVAERGEDIIHEANQTDETRNATNPSSLVKEAESLLFEDKGIPKETSPEEKREEGTSIMLPEEDSKEIDKQTSEPVHFSLEMNHNEESLKSSVQTSVGTEAAQTLQEEPQEKMEQPLNNMEETVAGPQDDEGDAETAKQDVASESNNERLPLEHVGQYSVQNFKNDGDVAEKSNIEILEQLKAVENIKNITHEIDQNDSPNIITPAALAEDIESLQYEDKDIAVEASAEEKKEEPSLIKTGEDSNGSITVIEENTKAGDQDTSMTRDYSAHGMIQNEESLNSSTQASALREEETLGSDNLTLAEGFTKKDEGRENHTGQIEVGEHKEDAKEILQKVAQNPIKNFKNDGDGAEKSNQEILEQPKAEESVENITDETNQNDSPNATNLAAPAEDVESLQCEDKHIAIEALGEEKTQEPSSVKISEDSNGSIIMIEENNKEGDQETCKKDDYSTCEMAQNEESLSSSIQASQMREEEILGSDNLTPVEASINKDEGEDSYTGLIDVEHKEELLEKEEDAEQILQKDEPKENIEEPLNVKSMETEAETLSEFKETVESPQDNEKRDAGRENDVIDENKIKSLPLESVAENPVKFFENDDPKEKKAQNFQDNAKNTEIPEEEDEPKQHIIDECNTKSLSKEPVDQGTTKDIQNDEDNDEISNKEILGESSKVEVGESIALETNQNYEITNITIPTAPVKEGESLQDESENVNLEEPSLEAKKEDDGSLAKASQVNGCNVELAEATEQSEAERSHGEENMEPKLQNEPEGFLDSSSDVITQVSDTAILDKKAHEISIPEDLPTVQYNEKTEEEETKGNEDSDGTKLNGVSANEDIKLTAETYDANEVVEEKSVTSKTDLGTTTAHVSDYSENLYGEHFQGDNIPCLYEDTEKHIIMEEANLIKENKEIAQIEMHKECELPHIAEDTTQQVLDKVNIERDQCTEPAIVIADDVAVMVPKTEMHEIIQATVENSNTREQIMQESRETEDILEAPLRGIDAEGLPEKDKDDKNDTIKSKQQIEGIKTELTEESAAVFYELAKVENLKDKQGSDIDLYPVKASEEGIIPKESIELDAICLKSISKEETLGEEEPSISCVIKDKSIEEIEEEDRKQQERFGPHTQEGLVIVETTGTPLDCMSTNAPQDAASNLVENKDHEIQTEACRTEDLMFEILDKTLIEGSNNQNETIASATLSDKIPCDNLKESSLFPSNDSELMNDEESKPMDDNSAKDPTIHENLENEHISQVPELADDKDKITTAEEIPELAIEDIGKVRENEEAGSYNSQDLNQDLELHNEQYQVDQQEICKSETSKDAESSNVEDEASKCTESTNADKEEAILGKGGFSNKSEASLNEKDAAGNINQVVVTTKTESSGVPAEEDSESAEPSSMKLDHISEMVPSNQGNETMPISSPNKFEENQISEFVEQRSQGSPGSWQEIEEKTEPDLEAEDQINETRDVEDIKAAIVTEEVYTVEKAQGDETVEHFNKDGEDIKELHNVPTGGEIIHEVKESGLVSSEYLKATDSNEQTETGSLKVRGAQDSEKESPEDEDYQRNISLLNDAPTKETQEVIKEQIIDTTYSSSDKMKAASTLEVKAEPRLEEVQIDEKPVLVSDIPSDASSPHTAETDASQQDSMLFEENSANLPSKLPTDDKEHVTLENVALENPTVDDTEESREISDVHETKNLVVRELHTGEVREEIKEAVETVHRSQEKKIVTEAEDVIDHTPPKEITKEPEVPSLALPCKEEDCQTDSTIENIEKHTEKVEMTKDKAPENSCAFKTVEDRSLQIEVLDVSQLDLQVKKGSPDSPTEVHKEKGGTVCDTKEESEAASGTMSQSKCHSLGATEVNEVADDQTLHSEKSEEQYQTEPFVLLSKELELGSSIEIKKLADTMKGEELLEDEQRKSEEACLQKEGSSELQVSEPDLEPKEDEEESSNEAQKEVSATSIEIENKKEASESNLDSNSKGNEAAKEEQEEETTPVQTNYTDKSQEENLMPSNPLLSKEQEDEASTVIGSTEEKTKEIQSLEDEPKAIQDACLPKEETRELTVPSYEFQPHIDEQESLKETHDKEDGGTNGVKEGIEEVSDLVKSSSQDYTTVSEDKITYHQPQPTEKSKEENQISVAGLLFEKQEHKISTIDESIGGKTTREEEPQNAPKTIEEPPLQKDEPSEFKPSELEIQMGDDIKNESQKEVHDGEDGTAEKSLELQSQHETEKRNAEKMDLMALEHQGEKTTDATEVVHTEVTNEQIMEEKSYAKSSHAITPGEDETKESHQEHQQIIEETPGAQIFEKAILNQVESSVETSQREGVAGFVEATEIIENIHQQEKTMASSGKKEVVEATEIIENIHQQEKTMASSGKKEVVEGQQQEPNVETTKITEVGDIEAEEGRIVQGVKQSVEDENGKAIEETVSKDSGTISLQEMVQRSTREKEEVKAEKQNEGTEKAKSDEEEEEEEEEQKKNDSGSDGPVMVESSRDIEVKIVQKKSHNILSEVGSKVKHSIIKVKKAITGKSSSQTKQQQQNHSPK